MRHSHWDGDYPIYINPTFDEYKELTQWDTIRICIVGDNIAFASGHGNTHQSITDAMKLKLKIREYPETYIMFKEGDQVFFNLEDVSGERKCPWKRAVRRYFSQEHSEIIADLVANRI